MSSIQLTREQEVELAIAIRQGSIEARDRLVLATGWLVRRLAARYRRPGVPRADVAQEGILGLLRAAEEFDPTTHDCRFSTYAGLWVRAFMRRFILERGDVIRIPPHHHRIRGTETTEEQAKRLEASSAASTVFPLRADQPAVLSEDVVSRCDDIALVQALVDRLNPVETFILRARFGLDGEPATREVVAAQTGLSVAWVAKIQTGAMEKLRSMVDTQSQVEWKKPKLKQWRLMIGGKSRHCNARNKSDARAVFKTELGIDPAKGRLPKGTVVEEIA